MSALFPSVARHTSSSGRHRTAKRSQLRFRLRERCECGTPALRQWQRSATARTVTSRCVIVRASHSPSQTDHAPMPRHANDLSRGGDLRLTTSTSVLMILLNRTSVASCDLHQAPRLLEIDDYKRARDTNGFRPLDFISGQPCACIPFSAGSVLTMQATLLPYALPHIFSAHVFSRPLASRRKGASGARFMTR